MSSVSQILSFLIRTGIALGVAGGLGAAVLYLASSAYKVDQPGLVSLTALNHALIHRARTDSRHSR